jgi:O-antigen ligase
MRRIIWKMDMQLLKEHWLAGVGPGQIRPELQQLYYGFSEMAGLPIEYYDTHNEYLNIWISFGLAGIALLILILSVQAWRAVTSRSRLYLCLLVALCLCFMTENVLANQRGVVFYAFFTSLLFFSLLRPREAS